MYEIVVNGRITCLSTPNLRQVWNIQTPGITASPIRTLLKSRKKRAESLYVKRLSKNTASKVSNGYSGPQNRVDKLVIKVKRSVVKCQGKILEATHVVSGALT